MDASDMTLTFAFVKVWMFYAHIRAANAPFTDPIRTTSSLFAKYFKLFK